jgi:uncharacterized iron-regulated membrane protein
MAQIAMIIGSIALFVAGFLAWYTLWHRRVDSALKRVPVGGRRTVHPLRQDVSQDPRHH